MAAVLNAIALLAGEAMAEMNEQTAESAPEVPEYLIGEDGGFVVDPGSGPARAALVTHLFRISDAASRWPAQGAPPTRIVRSPDSSADAWARDAGFAM